jgi:DNA-binding transcriptional MocR family regulator
MTVNKYIDTVTIIDEALSTGERPLYRTIGKALSGGIRTGAIPAGSKLPPLRTLADALSVTVGTVGKAYAEVERQGLAVSRVGDGTYVLKSGESADSNAFDNAPAAQALAVDLTRNAHIEGDDVELLTESLTRLGTEHHSLQNLSGYLPDAGLVSHREAGALWLGFSGLETSADQVIVTNGAQHALLCTMMATLRKDDTLIAEHMTYPGLVAVARALGVRLTGLPIDAEGIVPEALEEMCGQQRIHALYCTPTIHNPTTGVMGLERRHRIAEICQRYDILIVEDDAHGVLVEPHPPSLACFAPAHTIVISSLSKAVSAGLRVGFIAAPPALVTRIACAVRASCWMATPLAAEIAARWITKGSAARLRNQQREEIRRRKAAVAPLLESLDARTHEDSYHYWITLPEPWRAGELERQLGERGVLVKTAEAFAIGRISVPQCIRVSVSCASEEQLLEGFRQLAKVTAHDSY